MTLLYIFFSQERLLHVLDTHCKRCNERSRDTEEPISAYDFVYLPIDFKYDNELLSMLLSILLGLNEC